MTIEKLRKRKDENIISGVEKKCEFFFFFQVAPIFTSLSLFFLSDKKNLIPTFLLVCFYQERKKMSHFQSRQSIFKEHNNYFPIKMEK
jgi:hypothetical protein